MAQTIQIRRGLFANLPSSAAAGELLFATDTGDIYVGTGTSVVKITANVESSYIPDTEKGAANGVATLGADSKIPTAQLPALAITDTFTATDDASHQALVLQKGDVVVRTDENKSYIAIADQDGTATDLTGYQELLTPSDAVISVNGATGAVTLDTDDIQEGVTNLYYTDTRANAAADARIQNAIVDTSASSTTLYSSQKIESIVSGSLNYKGAWNASTNTPTLSDATGTANDYYKVSVAGTQDLGSGSISFVEGDDVIHNGSIWERFHSAGDVQVMDDLQDVTSSAATSGQVLAWNGTAWAPITPTDVTDLTTAVTANNVTVESSTGTDAVISAATGTDAGVMSSADKTKLDGIEAGAEVNVQANWAQTDNTQDNFIQNKPTDLTDLSTHTVDELSDVTVTSIQTDDYLKWDGTAWVNTAPQTLSIDELDDVDTTTAAPSNGQTLTWDGTNWVPTSLPSGVDGTFKGLTDTPAAYTGTAGYTLKVNATEDAIEFVDTSVVDGGSF